MTDLRVAVGRSGVVTTAAVVDRNGLLLLLLLIVEVEAKESKTVDVEIGSVCAAGSLLIDVKLLATNNKLTKIIIDHSHMVVVRVVVFYTFFFLIWSQISHQKVRNLENKNY